MYNVLEIDHAKDMDMWNMNLHFMNVHWCESPLMLDQIIMFWIKCWIEYELIPIYCQDELKISSSWSCMVWFYNKFEAKFHKCKHHIFVLYERLAHCNAKVGKNDHHIIACLVSLPIYFLQVLQLMDSTMSSWIIMQCSSISNLVDAMTLLID